MSKALLQRLELVGAGKVSGDVRQHEMETTGQHSKGLRIVQFAAAFIGWNVITYAILVVGSEIIYVMPHNPNPDAPIKSGIFYGFLLPIVLVIALSVEAARHFWKRHLRSVTFGICAAISIPVFYWISLGVYALITLRRDK